MSRHLLIAAVILRAAMNPATVVAGIINVPGDAATIQAGIDLAADFDTVMVAPDKYIENISILDKEILITGVDGPLSTFLYPADPNSPALTVYKWTKTPASPDGDFQSEFSGFTVAGGNLSSSIQIEMLSKILITGNIFHDNIPPTDNEQAVIVCHGDSCAPTIARNIFYDNYGSTCISVLQGSARIINNTFDANRSAFISLSNRATALNNIIVNCYGTAADGVYARLDYNDLWNNTADYG